MSNSCCSVVSERESVPFLRYGPYRPFCADVDRRAVLLGDRSDDARQREELQRGVEVDGREVHALEQRRRARLGLRGRLAALRRLVLHLGQHLGDVGPVAAGLGDDLVAGQGILAQDPTVVGRRVEQLARLRRSHLVGGDVVGDRGAARRLGHRRHLVEQHPRLDVDAGRGDLLDVGAVAAHADDHPVASGIVEISRASISPRSSTSCLSPSADAASSPK